MLRPLDALQVNAFLNHLPERTEKRGDGGRLGKPELF